MAATGVICPGTCRPTQLYSGIINSGAQMAFWSRLWLLCIQGYGNKPKKTTMDKVAAHRFTSGEEYVQCGCTKSKGFCHYKCTNGREFWDRFSAPKSLIIKRHLAVDTLGLPFLPTVLKLMYRMIKAEIELVSHNLDYFRAKPVNIPKVTILHRRRVSPGQAHGRPSSHLSTSDDQD